MAPLWLVGMEVMELAGLASGPCSRVPPAGTPRSGRDRLGQVRVSLRSTGRWGPAHMNCFHRKIQNPF